jgi:hypothetical protein
MFEDVPVGARNGNAAPVIKLMLYLARQHLSSPSAFG